jgi:hypothetical protein
MQQQIGEQAWDILVTFVGDAAESYGTNPGQVGPALLHTLQAGAASMLVLAKSAGQTPMRSCERLVQTLKVQSALL